MSRPGYIVVTGLNIDERAAPHAMKEKLARAGYQAEVGYFRLPENLKFGSFDDLVRLADQSASYDNKVSDTFKSIDRTLKDLRGNTTIQINMPGNHKLSHETYMGDFEWDDTKYPRTRPLRDNVDVLVSGVVRHSEEIRAKTYAYNEVKSLLSKIASKQANLTSYVQAELLDVLTPETVRPDTFVESEHLTTAVIVVPSTKTKEFLAKYTTLGTFIVPESAEAIGVPADKDGNRLYRVVLFRSELDSFASRCKLELGCFVRKFHFDPQAYHNVLAQRAAAETQRGHDEHFLENLCLVGLSDVWVAWTHLKGVRAYCESVLRFGVASRWRAFLVKVPDVAKAQADFHRVRDAIAAALAPQNSQHAHAKKDDVPREFTADVESGDNFLMLPIFG